MGSKFTSILEPKKIDAKQLRRKRLAVDAFNTLYMFLTTIRGRDGSPLTTHDGHITSHLVGLFNRFTSYLEHNMKFVFIFDGDPPRLKQEERQRRKKRKQKAQKKYEEAKQQGNVKNMKKYAARTAFLTKEMQEESKELIKLLGMDYIDAPSEGEAQAALLTKNGDAYAVISQDADSLLNGATRVIRNLNISGRRKLPGKQHYRKTHTKMYELHKIKQRLNLSLNQIIVLAMLVGTDYNYGGVKGIGPKRGLNLLEKHGEDFETLFEKAKWDEHCKHSWKKVYKTIKDIPVKEDYTLSFSEPQYEKIPRFLQKYDFSVESTKKTVQSLKDARTGTVQTGLSEF